MAQESRIDLESLEAALLGLRETAPPSRKAVQRALADLAAELRMDSLALDADNLAAITIDGELQLDFLWQPNLRGIVVSGLMPESSVGNARSLVLALQANGSLRATQGAVFAMSLTGEELLLLKLLIIPPEDVGPALHRQLGAFVPLLRRWRDRLAGDDDSDEPPPLPFSSGFIRV